MVDEWTNTPVLRWTDRWTDRCLQMKKGFRSLMVNPRPECGNEGQIHFGFLLDHIPFLFVFTMTV